MFSVEWFKTTIKCLKAHKKFSVRFTYLSFKAKNVLQQWSLELIPVPLETPETGSCCRTSRTCTGNAGQSRNCPGRVWTGIGGRSRRRPRPRWPQASRPDWGPFSFLRGCSGSGRRWWSRSRGGWRCRQWGWGKRRSWTDFSRMTRLSVNERKLR